MVTRKKPTEKERIVIGLQLLAKAQGIIEKLPKNLHEYIPRKWEKHGDLILFPAAAFEEQFWNLFDDSTLWPWLADQFRVKRVAKQDRIKSNDYRSPNVRMLLGSDPWVIHVDNQIKYTFNVTKCMFSSGNITEKLRMAKLGCKDEIVVDLFTGIGYFTIPLLVHGGARHVYSCEWNPDAVSALKKNLQLNKVEHKCTVLHGDNRQLAPVNVADRVLLGLIPTAEASYGAACRALNRERGGVLHLHHNVESKPDQLDAAELSEPHPTCNRKLKPAWIVWAKLTCERLVTLLETADDRRWKVCATHIERVKAYAPHIDHLVADISCFPISDV